jgi:hypothetical protein
VATEPIIEEAWALWEEANSDAHLPAMDRTRHARVIINESRFRNILPRLVAHHLGSREKFVKLTRLAEKLVSLCTVQSDGSAPWTEAFEQGRAGEVRRVLNDIRKLIGGE